MAKRVPFSVVFVTGTFLSDEKKKTIQLYHRGCVSNVNLYIVYMHSAPYWNAWAYKPFDKDD